jgi:hypothetical protein
MQNCTFAQLHNGTAAYCSCLRSPSAGRPRSWRAVTVSRLEGRIVAGYSRLVRGAEGSGTRMRTYVLTLLDIQNVLYIQLFGGTWASCVRTLADAPSAPARQK